MTRRPRALTALVAVIAALGAALIPTALLAHDGRYAESGELLNALQVWSIDAPGLAIVIVVGGLYAWGYFRLRRDSPNFHFPRWHAWSFAAGWLVMLLGLMSPVDTYSDDLFWMHMIQHVMITMIVAPLMLLGAPATLALRAASPRVRTSYLVPFLNSRLVRALTWPPSAIVIYIASVWSWHWPDAYDAAIASEAVHFVEHGVFLFGAVLLWWLVIGVDATRLRPHHVWRCALLVVAILQNIGLGLILINVSEPVYDTYATAAAVREWGPDALLDQRIGAGIMWVPGSMMFALAIIVTVYYWAEREGFKDRRNDTVRDMQIRVHGEVPTLGPRPGEQ
ncbi:MAG: cytochrome c oxidase assembly protein [Chloroflexi bacterium]|nr:cytochrome c oxidase assembly protein [Chloroflexota bacterium]